MADTMSPVVPLDGNVEDLSSVKDRAAGLTVGERVVIRQVTASNYESLVGTTAELASIDLEDPVATFRVRPAGRTNDSTVWVHRVERIDSEQPPPVEERSPAAVAEELAAVKAELERQQARAEELDRVATRWHHDLQEFRDQVRAKAIEVAESEGWCDDGLNEVLKELGLEPKEADPYDFEVTVRITVRGARRTDGTDEPDEEFIQSSIRDVTLELDGDWDEPQSMAYDVIDVSEVEKSE